MVQQPAGSISQGHHERKRRVPKLRPLTVQLGEDSVFWERFKRMDNSVPFDAVYLLGISAVFVLFVFLVSGARVKVKKKTDVDLDNLPNHLG